MLNDQTVLSGEDVEATSDTTSEPLGPEDMMEAGWTKARLRAQEISEAREKASQLDVSELSIEEKLQLLLALSADVADELSSPDAADKLVKYQSEREKAVDWGSLWSSPSDSSETSECSERDEKRFPRRSDIEAEQPFTEPEGAWLPRLLRQSVTAGRVLESAVMSMAGLVNKSFETGRHRELLGLPAGKAKYRNSQDYLRDITGNPRAQVRGWVQQAKNFLPPQPEPTGHQKLSAQPHLAHAFFDGSLHPVAANAILNDLKAVENYAVDCKVPGYLARLVLRSGQMLLGNQSRQLGTEELKDLSRAWREHTENLLDQDGLPPAHQRRKKQPRMVYKGYDQTLELHGWSLKLDQLQHELFMTYLSSATNPATLHTQERAQKIQELFGEVADKLELDTDGLPVGPLAQGDGSKENESADREVEDSDAHVIDSLGEESPEGLEIADDLTAGTQLSFDPLDPDYLPTQGHVKNEPVRVSADIRQIMQLEAFLVMLQAGARQVAGTKMMPRSRGTLPRLSVMIDFETLKNTLERESEDRKWWRPGSPQDGPPDKSRPELISQATFTGQISPRAIRHMACDAGVIPVVLNGDGVVLNEGEEERTATPEQRVALIARDKGCATPGCTMPSAWCEAHHIEHWAHGGPTDLDNLVLLCGPCHRAVHDQKWTIEMHDGLPWFIPALWVQPTRTPQRNTYWNVPSQRVVEFTEDRAEELVR